MLLMELRIIAEVFSENSQRKKKLLVQLGKEKVQQLDKNTEEVVNTYNSIADTCKAIEKNTYLSFFIYC